MFTGIVETVGTISQMVLRGDAGRLRIDPGTLDMSDVVLGDSIAVSGPCLTVVEIATGSFEVDVSQETLARTTLGQRQLGDGVNLEKALRLNDRLGGHLVSGHIDGIGKVSRREPADEYIRFVTQVPVELARYLAFKGSVCMDGVSLTINAAGDDWFEVLTIPHTLERTTLGTLDEGDSVNVEVDLIARYIERLIADPSAEEGGSGMTLAKLIDAGFTAR